MVPVRGGQMRKFRLLAVVALALCAAGCGTSAGTAKGAPSSSAAEPPAADYPLAPGARARTLLYTVNGYGGYDPSSPECAHPATYHNLSVQLGNGDVIALSGFTLDVKCGDILVYNWAAA